MKKTLFILCISLCYIAVFSACSEEKQREKMVETKLEETVVGTALAQTESIEEVTRVPVLQAEDFNLRLLDDSQSIIELSKDIFHEESVDYYKERAQTNNYLDCPDINTFAQIFNIKYCKKYYDDRIEQIDKGTGVYPGFSYYTILKTDGKYKMITFYTNPGNKAIIIDDIEYSEDNTEKKIADLKEGQFVSDVIKIDPEHEYTIGKTGRTDYPYTSYHFYRRGVFYAVRYTLGGTVIDSVKYTM